MRTYMIKRRKKSWGLYAVELSVDVKVGEVKARSIAEAERKAIEKGLVKEKDEFFVAEIISDDRVIIVDESDEEDREDE